LTHYDHLFTQRQLVALTTFSDLVNEAGERIHRDAVAAGLPDDNVALNAGGRGAHAYMEAVSLYMAFSVSKATQRNNTLCNWEPTMNRLGGAFGRQAIPMSWDFAETNPLAGAGGDIRGTVESLCEVLDKFVERDAGMVVQCDATRQELSLKQVVSTDPPYYDNIGYADLSDFFYVWLRSMLRPSFPQLLSTIAVPKAEELIAAPYRHGGKDEAEQFFISGMTGAIGRIREQAHPAVPVTIYYAFKQSETSAGEGTSSSGWSSFLEAVISTGFAICGTWPMRTELTVALKKRSGVLASSIILVCRPRSSGAGTISRRQFVRMLNESLPAALDTMTRADEGEHSPVAPVDLSQAIIGPGMAIFSRYDAVLEADGSPMSVKTALQLINRFLAEDDFDADTQFCLSWFEQHGWDAGKFGEADILARAKGTSVDGVKQAGVAEAGGGSVRLLRWKEYAVDWDPSSDVRLPVWEALHQLIHAYNTKGDAGAAKVLADTASKAEAMRQLAYRLYTVCERKGRADDARSYNEVVTGWTGIETAASKESAAVQGQLFEN
jgi:putative DNA methylase